MCVMLKMEHHGGTLRETGITVGFPPEEQSGSGQTAAAEDTAGRGVSAKQAGCTGLVRVDTNGDQKHR